MKKIVVKEIEFKTSRGMSPSGRRYEYNTMLIFKVENDELATGVEPNNYLKLKKLLGENLTSLEKVMESSVKEIGKSKSFFEFFCNRFIQPKLELLFSEIEKIVVHSLNVHSPPLGYDLEATMYLINHHEIENFNCPEAAVMARLGKKPIYILEHLFKERDEFLKEREHYQREIIKRREKLRSFQRRMYG
ncbi:MAG: hypothetical protein ACTSR3_10580 [Candidatus Helarchaeota archaeon]